MQNIFENYINSISTKFSHEETSEMGYRTDFEILLKGIFESINVKRIDHDARSKSGNKPDFIILKFDIPILYIETKKIGENLDKIEKSEQMARYFGYANLVLTDYLEFRFYRNGERYEEPIKIADHNINKLTINPNPENYEHLAKSLIDFTQTHKEPIKNGLHLAKIMGGKAQRIRDNLLQFLSDDSKKNSEINKIYKTLKKLLVHDLSTDAFADMYAQTLVYGLFVARYHDSTPENFSRREARELVPASNPFLRHFFDHIVGADFDKRLEYIVDELCEVFSHANIPLLMKQYFKDDLWGNTHEGPDPVIHFYEDFLREYDAKLRKKLGAYYTPQPVVRFIVRTVDHLLTKEFGLQSGLADTTKLQNGIHKVQILDPAVGTGTFLSAVIRSIYLRLKNNNQIGRWHSYVHNDLLPRIHGFEIMMAPYTIAHLKLSMAFKATGFIHFNRRLGIYLTNSLEESDNIGDLFTGFGFAESIAEESKEASLIKNDTPIMVVIGNPPYSVSSSNKGKWITNLIKDYKKDLNERNIQPLSDDYIKFIRYAEHYIEKNKTGIVAMITNNSFLDGIIHRQMRKHLLETFDEIYVLDLHGNSKKKETAPDGSKDENVFDIQQGVAISIMIRKNVRDENVRNENIRSKNKIRHENILSQNNVGDENIRPLQNKNFERSFGIVKFAELYGKRKEKFLALNENKLNTIDWKNLKLSEPYYFFSKKDFKEKSKYETGFKIEEIFSLYSSGIKTHRDSFVMDFDRKELERRINLFIDFSKSDIEIQKIYDLKNTTSFNIKEARKQIAKEKLKENIKSISYRPFDERWIYYSSYVIDRDRKEIMINLLQDNVAIITKRGIDVSGLISITKNIFEIRAFSNPGSQGSDYGFPLYLYSEDGTEVPNLKKEIVEEIEKITGKTKPEEILDYIYAVLHSPNYREKYKEFLKIDFPRVPFPKDKKIFKTLIKFGTELRELHLLESPKVNKFITTFPEAGSDTVEKIKFVKNNNSIVVDENIRPQNNNDNNLRNDNNRSLRKKINMNKNIASVNIRDENIRPLQPGNVYINEKQYFGNVPETAWNFYIGGYQPAQKWLKDRKGRKLTNEEIEHYQKIIMALTETDRIMKEIDKINFM